MKTIDELHREAGLLRARIALAGQERAMIDQLLEAHARTAGAKVAGVKKDDAARL